MNQTQCNICGNPDRCQWVIQYEEEKWLECCDQCNAKYLKCGTCTNFSPNLIARCRFATDPSPIPQTIQVTEQNGQLRIVTNKMNPKRMEITCVDCPCYNGEKCCAQYGQTCKNYQVKLTPINYST